MGSLFILVTPIVWLIFLRQYIGPWTQVWSWNMLFHVIFCKINATFQKEGNWVHLSWVKCIGFKQLTLVIFM